MDRVRKGADAEHQNNKRAGKKHGFKDPLVYCADMAVDLLTHDSSQRCPQCAGEQCNAMLTEHVIETSSGHFYSFFFIPGKKHSVSDATDRDV